MDKLIEEKRKKAYEYWAESLEENMNSYIEIRKKSDFSEEDFKDLKEVVESDLEEINFYRKELGLEPLSIDWEKLKKEWEKESLTRKFLEFKEKIIQKNV